jgi:hypothetical protein
MMGVWFRRQNGCDLDVRGKPERTRVREQVGSSQRTEDYMRSTSLVRCSVAAVMVIMGATQASAALPTGSVTYPAVRTMSVTAADADYHSVLIGLFIDGAVYDTAWIPNNVTGTRTYAPFGPGPIATGGAHTGQIVAFDVDSTGTRTGAVVQLTGSPASIFEDCSVFGNPAQSWCNGATDYYRTRQQTTVPIFNDFAWAGVATGMGGTIFQLYDQTRSVNLLAEHGGAAMQLGIWGYDVSGNPEPSWFKTRTCDVTPYPVTCPGAPPHSPTTACGCVDPPFCAEFGKSGAHLADCTTVFACEGWSAGAPWNVMPARGGNCTWGVGVTSQTQLYPQDPRLGLRTELDNPFNYTKSSAYPGTVVQEVRAPAGTEYIQLDLQFTNRNPVATNPHDQEFPAFHLNYDFDWLEWWYSSDSTPDGIFLTLPIPTPTNPQTGKVRLLGPGAPIGSQGLSNWNGEWVTTCGTLKLNSQVRKCVTWATFDADIKMADLCNNCNLTASGMTPLGYFGMSYGTIVHATVFIFPYAYSEAPAGVRVLDRINSLGSR